MRLVFLVAQRCTVLDTHLVWLASSRADGDSGRGGI
jgi:hypothetical protein